MAKKKPAIGDLFSKTTTTQADDAPADPITARGVGIKASEWAEVERLAGDYGLTAHALAVRLLRYGLDALKAGKIKSKRSKTLDL